MEFLIEKPDEGTSASKSAEEGSFLRYWVGKGLAAMGWRGIRPTLLGWLVIVTVFLVGGGVVASKHFRAEEEASDSLLQVNQIQADAEVKSPDLATLVLKGDSKETVFFQHVGETPVVVDGIAVDAEHVLRIEREGYRTVYRRVGPDDFQGSVAEVSIVMHPVTGKQALALPYQATAFTAGKGRIEVESDPPSATVWQLLGDGQVILPDRPANYYYFMALTDGKQPEYLSVSATDFTGDTIYLPRDSS